MLINRSTSLLNHTATLIICPKNDKTCRAKLYHFDWPSKKERIKGWDSEQFKNRSPKCGTHRIEHKNVAMYREFSVLSWHDWQNWTHLLGFATFSSTVGNFKDLTQKKWILCNKLASSFMKSPKISLFVYHGDKWVICTNCVSRQDHFRLSLVDKGLN